MDGVVRPDAGFISPVQQDHFDHPVFQNHSQSNQEQDLNPVDLHDLKPQGNHSLISLSQEQLSFAMKFETQSVRSFWDNSNILTAKESELLEETVGQYNYLYNMDPELADKYLAVLTMIEKEDPEAFERFVNTMGDFLGTIGNKGESAQIEQFVPQRPMIEGFSFSIELNVEVNSLAFEAQQGGDQLAFSYQDVKFSLSLKMEQQLADPLAVDLDHDGLETTGIQNGVMFDIDGDGEKERTSFIAGDDGMIVLDKNNNSKIDDVTELFGDKSGAAHGFDDLANYDDNDDQVINEADDIFEKLMIWRDINQNGMSEKNELKSASSYGIQEFQLSYKSMIDQNQHGDLITASSKAGNYNVYETFLGYV